MTTPSNHAWMAGFPATTDVCSTPTSRPAKSVTRPPASRTSSTPAAMSHADSCCSQKPSNRPAATLARSSAAAPGRRMPLVAPRYLRELARVFLDPRIVPEREAGADQGILRIGDGGDRQAPLTLPRAAAPRTAVYMLVARHMHDHAGLRGPVHRRRYRHRDSSGNRGESWWSRRAGPPPRPARPLTTAGLSSSPTIRLPGSAASSTSAISRSAVRSTSVTKSRASPWRSSPAGPAGRSTAREVDRRALGGGAWPDASKSKEDTILHAPSEPGKLAGHATHILRDSALRRAAHRQLARRRAELGQSPAQLRLILLRRGPACHHRQVRSGLAGPAHARDGDRAARLGHRPRPRDPLRAVARARALPSCSGC